MAPRLQKRLFTDARVAIVIVDLASIAGAEVGVRVGILQALLVGPVGADDGEAAGEEEEEGPGDDPELEEEAGPIDVSVVAEAVDPVVAVDGEGVVFHLHMEFDGAAVVCGA